MVASGNVLVDTARKKALLFKSFLTDSTKPEEIIFSVSIAFSDTRGPFKAELSSKNLKYSPNKIGRKRTGLVTFVLHVGFKSISVQVATGKRSLDAFLEDAAETDFSRALVRVDSDVPVRASVTFEEKI